MESTAGGLKKGSLGGASTLNLLAFTGQRLAFGLLVLLFIIFLSYLGLDMASGASFSSALRDAIPDTIAYIQRLLSGDLGMTTAGSETLLPRPVSVVIVERLPRSLGLLAASLLFASLVAVPLGVLAALGRSRRSLGILFLTLLGISIPSFFAAFLLQWAAIALTRRLGHSILPMGGFGWDSHIILPMLVLAARPVAQITRMSFVSLRQVLGQDYVRTAVSKGLHRYDIIAVHVMRNAAIPILTTIGISLRFSLSSLPVVELYFGWPGVGVTLLKGIAQGDTNLVIGLTLCLGMVFILVNLILELSYRWIDPRLAGQPEHLSSGERRGFRESIRSAWSALLDLLANNPVADLVKRGRPQGEPAPGYSFADLGQGRAEETPAASRGMRGAWAAVLKNFPLIVGGLMVAGLLAIVLFGAAMAPNHPLHTQGLVKIDGQLPTPPAPPDETRPRPPQALVRCILSQLLAGSEQNLTREMLAVAARLVVGVGLGTVAGWTKDSLLDRTILGMAEIISAFPTLLITMILILAVGIRQGMSSFVIALCFVGWGEIMQFVRSEVIKLRPMPFIESAVVAGSRIPRILTRHILPNLFSALVTIAALEMGAVLMVLGELGFISIFIGGGSLMALPSMTILYSDVPEWGALLSDIRFLVRSYPWTGLYPMLAFFVAILSFNLLGEGLRRLVDEGNPVFDRIFNRYTVLLILAVGLGYNLAASNFGAMQFYRQDAAQFDGGRALGHISGLAGPNLYGRALGSPGADLAALYLAEYFQELGLQAGGEKGTFFQYRKRGFERLLSEPAILVEDGGPPPVYGLDFAAYPGRNMTSGQASAPVRFIALGEHAAFQTPGWSSYYPDLNRADFTGEILLTLTDREAFYLTGRTQEGLLVVADDSSELARRSTLSGRTGKWVDFEGQTVGREIPYLWISEVTADRLLAASDLTVDELRETTAGHAHEQIFEIPLATRVSMDVEGVVEDKWPVKNIIGLWPGTVGYDYCPDCLGKKLIVVIAQYDSPPVGPEGVYPAANDNASGLAVLLEAIRVMKATGYQPYKSFLFVAYSGEGLDGGEPVDETDISNILQASPSFSNFELEAVVLLRGLGRGAGDRLEVSAGGSLRLAELFEDAAGRMGVRTVRSSEPIDISVIYDQGGSFLEAGQEAPVVRLFWEGWEDYSRLPADILAGVSADILGDAGRSLVLSLMILGRETGY